MSKAYIQAVSTKDYYSQFTSENFTKWADEIQKEADRRGIKIYQDYKDTCMNEKQLLKKRLCEVIDIYWDFLNLELSVLAIEGFKNKGDDNDHGWFCEEFIFQDLIKSDLKLKGISNE